MRFAKIALMVAGVLTVTILAMKFGWRGIWDAVVGFAICIDANGACPGD